MEGLRLRLRPRAKVEKIKELLGGIRHQRFLKLEKLVIKDLDHAGFKTLDLGLYMRLGGWSHTGGTYGHAMAEVRSLCREMFGYEIPEKIGSDHLRDYRYRTGKGLTEIGPVVEAFHQKQLAK